MEIANFMGKVSLRSAVNHNGKIRYLVIYGLTVENIPDFETAFKSFTKNARHAAECEGLLD